MNKSHADKVVGDERDMEKKEDDGKAEKDAQQVRPQEERKEEEGKDGVDADNNGGEGVDVLSFEFSGDGQFSYLS